MKSTAIWIDTREAKLVIWDGRRISLKTIFSGVEKKLRVEGEKSKKTRHRGIGFDYASNQKARFREDLKRYLKSMVDLLTDSDYAYLLGPADTKLQLEKEIKKDNKAQPVILKVESCDILTDNQLTEKVIAFFRERLKKKPSAPKRRLPPQGVRLPHRPEGK